MVLFVYQKSHTSYSLCKTTVLHGYMSRWCEIPSGIPQGSILGPLLFTLCVSDIKYCFHNSRILLYADDMKILKLVSTQSDTKELQGDLDRLVSYCHINKLELNVDKCFYVSFTRKNSIIGNGYTFNGVDISKVTKIKDLGVIFDSKFTFDSHVDYIIKKASKALGFIIRNSVHFRSLKPLKVLYCSYVRSHLEYASQVWNPQYDVYIHRIESIQAKFLRYLDFRARQFSVDYDHRCNRYHFLPLENRRKVNDICYLVSVANGSIDSPELLTNINLYANQNSLRKRPLLHIPFSSTNYRRNSFSLRSAIMFNSLSPDLHIDLFCTSTKDIKKKI
ncbi:hypothetical protein O3G_MSEX009346 [Manduca sexta]|uniref:Reverse transcriptase domain-containing protein n=1 Tax=Manduca sexta TaxID=7130 RepID=A0A921ZDM8_MANSE|nr:hypothetical protein O3G_MSEX009346 [Manduca sexta]